MRSQNGSICLLALRITRVEHIAPTSWSNPKSKGKQIMNKIMSICNILFKLIVWTRSILLTLNTREPQNLETLNSHQLLTSHRTWEMQDRLHPTLDKTTQIMVIKSKPRKTWQAHTNSSWWQQVQSLVTQIMLTVKSRLKEATTTMIINRGLTNINKDEMLLPLPHKMIRIQIQTTLKEPIKPYLCSQTVPMGQRIDKHRPKAQTISKESWAIWKKLCLP